VDGIKFYSHRSYQEGTERIFVYDLITMAQDLISDYCRVENIKFELLCPDKKLQVDCCPTEISQVLMNLIHNSIDAIESLEDKWIKVEVRPASEGIEFSVTDSGPRISDDLANKIMAPFFTTKERGKGTGLGLTISIAIIKRHGGHLNLDRTCDNMRFLFVLPCN
jgi:C4-dicarboxylate-specific signal transduction histidine kinase